MNTFTADGGPHNVKRIRAVADGLRRIQEFESAEMLTAYADAIDAHIAGMGEPVATICDGWDLRFVGSAPIAEVVRKHGLKIGDTLYIAPPIDVATVRGVIAELQCIGSTGVGKESEASLLEYINDAADRLEAAGSIRRQLGRSVRRHHEEQPMNVHQEMTPEFLTWLETTKPRTTDEARAAWRGWKAATSQPRVWLVIDDAGQPQFSAGWPQACHEHINEALAMDIDEARAWHVREAVLLPLSSNNQVERQP